MLFHIATTLYTKYSILNVFRYVSVRSIAALLTALFFSLLWGDYFLQLLRTWCRANVREETPEHHQKKNNTPTMGGVMMGFIFIVTSLLWCNLLKPLVWIFLFSFIGFFSIGFADDWYKIRYKKGISAQTKWYAQWIIAGLTITSWYMISNPTTTLCIPFFKSLQPKLGLLLIPWGMFIMVAVSNAVNLTDGLDGLATGPLIFNFITFGWIAYLASNTKIAHYLFIPYAPVNELTVIAGALTGALLGFLWYNTHPAEVFMGDVGSLAMGSSLGFLALAARQELLLPICGGIFMLETISVILQVFSFKIYGKRIFLMAPIHHHFELLGWKETKVTIRFWIISFVLTLLTLLTLKMR